MPSFDQVTTVSPAGQGQVSEEWAQGRTVFGGVVVGAAVKAAAAAVDPERPLRTVMVDFVAPLSTGPFHVEVQPLRAGRSLTHVEVRVGQGERLAAVVLTAWGADRSSKMVLAAPSLPAAPAPEERVQMPYLKGITPTFTQYFDYRWVSETLPFSGSDRAHIAGWVRYRDGAPVDVARVLGLIDSWPAPVLALLQAPAPASTATWMVDFLQAPPPGGWPGDGFWYFEGDAASAQAGYADVQGRLWGPDGRLVATSKQLVVEFSG